MPIKITTSGSSTVRFTLYKLTVKSTGQYYIGITSDFEKRKKDHLYKIFFLMKKMAAGEKTRVELPFYETIAAYLIAGRTIDQVTKDLLKDLRFKVLDNAVYTDDARRFESHHLEMANHNTLCLNSAKKSCYNKHVFISKS